jgi:hypothetical protein
MFAAYGWAKQPWGEHQREGKCSRVNRIGWFPVDGCRLAGGGQQKRALGSAIAVQQKSDGGTGIKPRS